jgi:hypothetical protein
MDLVYKISRVNDARLINEELLSPGPVSPKGVEWQVLPNQKLPSKKEIQAMALPIVGVHTMLVNSEACKLDLCFSSDFVTKRQWLSNNKALNDGAAFAETCAVIQKITTYLVVHVQGYSCNFPVIADGVKELLDKYPHVKLYMENESKNNQEIVPRFVQSLRNCLPQYKDRLYSLFDTTHARMSIRHQEIIQGLSAEKDFDLQQYLNGYSDLPKFFELFQMYFPTLGGIHFANCINYGIDKDHGTGFDEPDTFFQLFLRKYKEMHLSADFILEIRENDYEVPENTIRCAKLINEFYAETPDAGISKDFCHTNSDKTIAKKE